MEPTGRLISENIHVFNKHFPQYAKIIGAAAPDSLSEDEITDGSGKALRRFDLRPNNDAFYYYFNGAGDGATPLLFFERLEERRLLFIVEHSPHVIASAFAAHDFRPAIESERLLFFIGDNALDDLSGFLKAHADIDIMSAYSIISCDDSATDIQQAGEEMKIRNIISKLRTYHKNMAVNFYNNYHAPDITSIAEKHRNGDPLRIMFIKGLGTVYLQYAVRDLEQAALELGHFTRTVRDGSGYFFTPGYIASEISDFKPDVVIELGCSLTKHFMRHFDIIAQPHIVWFFDNPPIFVKSDDVPALEARHRAIVALLPLYVRELRSIGFDGNVPVVPVGVNGNMFSPETPRDSASDFGHDVVFIGNIINPLVRYAQDLDKNTTNVIMAMREFIYERIDAIYSAEDAARRYLGSISPDFLKDDSVLKEIMSVATAVFREMHRYSFIVQAAKKNDMHIYGSGWESYPGIGVYHGVIKNGPALAALYGSSSITLQVHELTQIHPRVLECLSAGGFILAREIPPDPDEPPDVEMFVPGEEIAVFHDRAEMTELISYFLKNKEVRISIARAGRERVLRDFTWQARIKTLLNSTLLADI